MVSKNALARRFHPSNPLDTLARRFLGYDPWTSWGDCGLLDNSCLLDMLDRAQSLLSDRQTMETKASTYVDRTEGGEEFTVWTKGTYPKIRIEKKLEEKALKGLLVTAAIPGLSREEISVDVQKGVITIETGKKESPKEEISTILFNEIPMRHSKLEVGINGNMDWDNIAANFLENGLLEIYIPAIEKPKPTRVQIQGK